MMSARKLAVLVVVCLAAATLASAANQPVAPQSPPVMKMEGARTAPAMDRAAYSAYQARMHQWLVREQVPDGLATPLVVPRNEAKLEEIARDAAPGRADTRGRQRVGYSQDVGVRLGTADAWSDQLSRRALDLSHGAVRATDDGFVYTAAVHSEGAKGLRLHLTGVMLPEGAELWVYGPGGGAHGPYTFAGPGGTGDFWTNTVWNDTVIVQVHYSGYELDRALGASSFNVAQIAYLADEDVIGPSPGAVYRASNLCTDNADCVDAATGNEGWNDAIALIYFVSGAYWYICSGGAITDASPAAAPYYFLTANHCISRDRSAGTLEAYWDFTPNACGDGCSGPCSSVPMSSGSSVAASNKTGDYTILSLDSAPPLGAYLGWYATPVYDTAGYALQRLSHPQGSPQAYSTHSVDTTPPAVCSSWPRGPWIYSHDETGATEGGSSGSPVLNADMLVVGQLSGGCGYNVNDVCDNTNNSTVDGAFAYYYADVAGLLGGGGGTNQPPTASFTYSCSGLDCTFDGRSSSDSDGSITSYAWDFGDGAIAGGATVSHSYASGGTYGVTLTVTDNDDATGSTSQDVSVSDGSQCVPKGGACSDGSECCSGRCHPKKGVCQ